ncbi:glucuronate isomerase [Parapedobacter sp. ISTM3]|uniref:Uronate isomerase n=1 Tax=Parapedobacter luteus TaxID=623280 RepID=A0A1T5CZJ9_9SPHI|nr:MULTISPECIES: glucuronate isomerase [Parapedobacter]MBK1440598.1 glucuronate isomerase [Parapedobacter sp. ISTM3]SKB64766.1 glucuronate isomerase [Parapedobacter luteus]
MAYFLHDNFLLQSDTAEVLYHDYAKGLPIIDYHSHLPPDAIATDANFRNITHIWLAGDHYKWRAQRVLGVSEKYITGDADDREKFRKWAEAVPYTLRNPLYHWTHMELKNPFGIHELLSPDNADAIFDSTQAQLRAPEFSPRGLLRHFAVDMVGTTDDPADDLRHHQAIAESGFGTKVLPTFRPDKAFQLSRGDDYRHYIERLQASSGVAIVDMDTLLDALWNRAYYFHSQGCRIADHGLSCLPRRSSSAVSLDEVFKQVLNGDDRLAAEYEETFTYTILFELCKFYHDKGWVQQFHLGPLRNTNSRKLRELGADTGYDSIGDFPQAENMQQFFNDLEEQGCLAKTIVYNLNPSDNAVFAAMMGNFQSEGIKGKMQFGSGWWFLDQLDGMTQQMNTLSNIGLISCFVGMLTDSRSFLSYSRHEYFRRLLCNLFAEDIERGLLPRDIGWTGKIIQDICYYNAKAYFGLPKS